ncbi:MAG: lipid-A-disaccharide synthase N-terminal domain-containing protein [Bradyrhizobium sp.]
MLIQYGQALGDYLYDVFVAKFDFWLAFGLIAQLLFTARFLVQWISSERAGQSVVPMAFWFFSMGGGLMTLIYGVAKREPVIILGQSMATVIYIRNIMLIMKSHAKASKTLDR